MKNTKKNNSQLRQPISQATSSLKNKTGSWRIYRPVVDYDICIGCSLCAKFCPDACIKMHSQKKYQGKIKPIIDLDYCKGCGLCAKECPVKAIKMLEDF